MAAPTFYKGNQLMVSIDGSVKAYATNATMSVTPNFTEVSTKDHGDFPGKSLQSINWEMTTENLYTSDAEALKTKLLNGTDVTVIFGRLSEANHNGISGVTGEGDTTSWDSALTAIFTGTAKITSFTINAPNGDNATWSATFSGSGGLS